MPAMSTILYHSKTCIRTLLFDCRERKVLKKHTISGGAVIKGPIKGTTGNRLFGNLLPPTPSSPDTAIYEEIEAVACRRRWFDRDD